MKSGLWLAAVAAFGLATSAAAQTFTPAPGLGAMSIDLDTDAGKYSEWKLTDLSTVNALRTTMTVHRLGQDSRWLPAFSIWLEADKHRLGLRLVADDRKAPLAVMIATQTAEDAKPMTTRFGDSLPLDTALEVAIDWTPSGVVTIRAGKATLIQALGGPPTVVKITGSTGEAAFAPLTLGKVAP